MRFISNPSLHWILAFVLKVLGWVAGLNLIVLLILWVLEVLHLFTLILIYEALFILVVGVFEILGSYIYRKNSLPYRWGPRTGWFDFKRFAELKPEERQRHRLEGLILAIIGLGLLCATVVSHLYYFWY